MFNKSRPRRSIRFVPNRKAVDAGGRTSKRSISEKFPSDRYRTGWEERPGALPAPRRWRRLLPEPVSAYQNEADIEPPAAGRLYNRNQSSGCIPRKGPEREIQLAARHCFLNRLHAIITSRPIRRVKNTFCFWGYQRCP